MWFGLVFLSWQHLLSAHSCSEVTLRWNGGDLTEQIYALWNFSQRELWKLNWLSFNSSIHPLSTTYPGGFAVAAGKVRMPIHPFLILGDPKAFPVQLRDIMSPVCSGSAPRSLPSLTCLEHLHRVASWADARTTLTGSFQRGGAMALLQVFQGAVVEQPLTDFVTNGGSSGIWTQDLSHSQLSIAKINHSSAVAGGAWQTQ